MGREFTRWDGDGYVPQGEYRADRPGVAARDLIWVLDQGADASLKLWAPLVTRQPDAHGVLSNRARLRWAAHHGLAWPLRDGLAPRTLCQGSAWAFRLGIFSVADL